MRLSSYKVPGVSKIVVTSEVDGKEWMLVGNIKMLDIDYKFDELYDHPYSMNVHSINQTYTMTAEFVTTDNGAFKILTGQFANTAEVNKLHSKHFPEAT